MASCKDEPATALQPVDPASLGKQLSALRLHDAASLEPPLARAAPVV